MAESRRMTPEAFHAEARARFGDDFARYRFECPSCGHVASVQDWRDAGAPDSAIAFSCIGRWLGADDTHTFRRAGGPCTYAGGGLIGLTPWTITPADGPPYHIFALASASEGVKDGEQRREGV